MYSKIRRNCCGRQYIWLYIELFGLQPHANRVEKTSIIRGDVQTLPGLDFVLSIPMQQG